MNYGKITTNKQIQVQPNPVFVSISNPNEEQKKTMANLRGELELVYTEQPPYNPETQYLTQEWNEVNGKAVQSWIIHDIEEAQ